MTIEIDEDIFRRTAALNHPGGGPAEGLLGGDRYGYHTMVRLTRQTTLYTEEAWAAPRPLLPNRTGTSDGSP